MILNLLLLFFFGHNINEEIAIENLVGNWKRVCLENDALLSKSAIKIEKSRNLLGVKVKKYNSSASKLDAISHCNFFGDKEMFINEWNYIEMTFKNGERRFYDFKLDGDKIDIFYKYKEKIESSISINGDTLIIESNEVYNELMNRKFENKVKVRKKYQGVVPAFKGVVSWLKYMNPALSMETVRKMASSVVKTLKTNQTLYPQELKKRLSKEEILKLSVNYNRVYFVRNN